VFWIAIAANLAAIAGFFILLVRFAHELNPRIQSVGESIVRVEKRLLSEQLAITEPEDGDSVLLDGYMRGTTPVPGMNHYVVVTPLGTGDAWGTRWSGEYVSRWLLDV